ncbi:hypothetical protein L0152_20310 [bacterium]|nr:hypothetical protein [bacterium]
MEELGIEQKKKEKKAKLRLNLANIQFYYQSYHKDGFEGTAVITCFGFEHWLLVPYRKFDDLFMEYIEKRDAIYVEAQKEAG